ncbi:MAG: hypothetical protein OEM52_10355 [bacterium]|nr:hypothetical protein [bacterium]
MSYFDTDNSHSVFGGNSLRLVGDSTTPNVVTGHSNSIPVANRDSVVISAYVFVPAITAGTTFTGVIEYIDKNGSVLSTGDWLKLTASNSQFTRYYAIKDVTTFPKDTVAIQLSFSLTENAGKPTGTVYVDCVKCEYGNKLTGYSESVFYEEICQHIGGFGVGKIGASQIDKDSVTSEQLATDNMSLEKMTGSALQYDGSTIVANNLLNACKGLAVNGNAGITQTIEVPDTGGGKYTIVITDGIITSIT